MLPPDLVDAIEAGHRALNAIVQGNPELKNRMFSHREDVCLANYDLRSGCGEDP